MITSPGLSEALGYTSILCWLFAQFPQIIVNMRTKSVEGLALPFLANWFFGDMLNLIGCLLTNQLPFQIYLAAYYCFCDACLVTQYLYYYKPTPPPRLPTIHSRYSSQVGRSYSTERTPTLRRLSTAAANVAIAAAQAASEQEARLHGRLAPARSQTELRGNEEEDDDVMDLTESFHSEDGRGKARHIAWSRSSSSKSPGNSRYPTVQVTASSPRARSLSMDMSRGRPLIRDLTLTYDSPIDTTAGHAESEWTTESHRSMSVRKGSKTRRSASIVFLGVWALFGIGSLSRSQLGAPSGSLVPSVGVVLTTPSSVGSLENLQINVEPQFHHEPGRRPPPTPSKERIIGRVSAWLCTTLYLTSRLPQIWKNFVRKSVEGLSIYLFLFAFLGNSFYVLALLTSSSMSLPPPGRINFLKESLPYLLGSGGTLLFDITIVSQVLIYRGRAPRRSRSRMVLTEEEGLLYSSSERPGSVRSTIATRGRRRRYGSMSAGVDDMPSSASNNNNKSTSQI